MRMRPSAHAREGATPFPRPRPLPAHARLLLAAALALALASGPALAQEDALPAYLPVCKRSGARLGECIKASVEALRPRLADGLPELKVPPLEPLHLPQLSLSQGPKLHVEASDVLVYDASAFQLQGITVDEALTEFRFRLAYPRLRVRGRYAVDGQLMTMPMRGTGPMQLNATAVEAEVALHTAVQERGGEEFLALQALEVQVHEVRQAVVRLDNLFGGDPLLGEVVNAAVNAHFPSVLQELRPQVQQALQEALQETAAAVLASYPLRLLLPDD